MNGVQLTEKPEVPGSFIKSITKNELRSAKKNKKRALKRAKVGKEDPEMAKILSGIYESGREFYRVQTDWEKGRATSQQLREASDSYNKAIKKLTEVDDLK